MRFIWTLLFGSLMLMSCASPPDFMHAMQATTAEMPEIPDAWHSETTPGEVHDPRWWRHFGEPALDSLMVEMLTHNHNLDAAANRLDLALAQSKIAGASLYPQLNASVSATRRKQNFLGFPIGGGAAGEVQSSLSTTYGASLNLSWEIDLWGRIQAGKAAATADVQAAQAELFGTQLSLSGQLAKVWFAAIEARLQLELARATYDNYKTSNQQIRTRYEKGLRQSLDLRLSESAVATAEASLHTRQRQFEALQRQLEVLLGRYPAAEIAVGGNWLPTMESVPAGLPADLISRRPDLVAAERRVAAADRRVAQAKRSLLPALSLTASGGTSTDELEDLTNGDFSVWNLVGNLVQPIFQGGRLRAQVDLNNATYEQQLALYAQSALVAFSEVENALAAENYLAQQEAALSVAREQAVAARQLAEDRYQRGLADIITMLEAQRSAFQSESQLLMVQRQRIDNRIDLFLALGGGFDVTDVIGELSPATSQIDDMK